MQPRSVNLVKDVSIERQGQGTDYETHRSVLFVREDCRISCKTEICFYETSVFHVSA